MNKYFYIVFAAKAASPLFETEKDDKTRYYAGIMRVSSMDNIASRLENIGGLMHANICQSKKEAENIRDIWNKSYQGKNIYAFA
jgi:hypothetical protein